MQMLIDWLWAHPTLESKFEEGKGNLNTTKLHAKGDFPEVKEELFLGQGGLTTSYFGGLCHHRCLPMPGTVT